MSNSSPWIAYYEVLPDGRRRITRAKLAAFESMFPDRILTIELNQKPETLLLLDRPYVVGDRQTTYDAHYLIQVSVKDIPSSARDILREKP